MIREHLGDTLQLYPGDAVWSPDDQAILYWGFRVFLDFSDFASANVLDARSGEIIRTFIPDGETLISSIAWSPDGSQVAASLFGCKMLI